MSKIIYNLKEEKYELVEGDFSEQEGISIELFADNIVLKSVNSIRYFTTHDYERENKDLIKTLLSTGGFSVLTENMEILVAQLYNICPKCGEDIDFNASKSSLMIWHLGDTFKSLLRGSIVPCKPVVCPKCSNEHVAYGDIFMSIEESKEIRKISAYQDKLPVFIRLNYTIDNDTRAYVPITIRLDDFSKFYTKKAVTHKELVYSYVSEKWEEEFLNNIMGVAISCRSTKDIILSMLNADVLDAMDIQNIDIQVGSPVLGVYSKYDGESGFKKIKKYMDMSSCKKIFNID